MPCPFQSVVTVCWKRRRLFPGSTREARHNRDLPSVRPHGVKLAKAAVTPPGLAVTMLLLPGLKPGATRLSPFGALGPTQHVVLTWVKCIPRFRQYIAAFPAYTVLLGGGAAEENRKLRAAQGRMCRNPC